MHLLNGDAENGVGPRWCHIHFMRPKSFVSYSKVKQMQDLFKRINFDINQVFNCKNVKFVPFKPKSFAGIASQLVKRHLGLPIFEHLSVEQVKNLLIVKLKEWDGDWNFSISFG